MNNQSQLMRHLRAHKAIHKRQKTNYFREYILPFFQGYLEDRKEHYYYHCAELNCQYYAKSDKAFFIDTQKWVENGAEEILHQLDII